MAQLIATNQLTLTNVIDGKDGVGLLTTWNFYKLSNSTSAPQVVPIGASTNLSHLGPNNAWAPFKELSGGSSGWNVIDFDKIAKSNIIPDKPFIWYLEAGFDGVSNFNDSTDFNIKFENWYVNSAGSTVYNSLGTRDFQANKFSATNDTAITNYFSQSVTWTVPRAVYDAIPEGGFLNLRIRIDRFTKLFYHAKNSYVTYGTVPSDPAQRGLGNYSTYGWKASPEVATQALPYLWIYQIQLYDNGREVAITPTLIGTQGADGVSISNVKPYFILSNTPTGVVRTSGTWSTTPLTPTLSQKYVWTYLETTLSNGTKQYSEPYITGVYGDKGDQGVPGPPGKDGLPTYIHWAYSDNADGTGLTTSDNGQRYIGQYSDNTKTDSTDKTKYRWADRWAKIGDAGTLNLLAGTKTMSGNQSAGFVTSDTYNGFTVAKSRAVRAEGYTDTVRQTTTVVPTADSYILSFYAKADANISVRCYFYAPNTTKSVETSTGYKSNNASDGCAYVNVTTDWKRYWVKWTQTDTTTVKYIIIGRNFDTTNYVYIAGQAIYAGGLNKDWSPAIEDIQKQLDIKADQALTQEQINALNEKNQILEAELQAKASMDAFSEFEKAYQAFVKANADGQAKAEADLVEAGRRIEMLTTQFGGLSELKTFIDTYMSSSNEGLIIGKNDASSTIKVSSDRISMFSAGKEVMYISQGVININNGIFTVSVQIGKFRTEQYHLNADMNVMRYVG